MSVLGITVKWLGHASFQIRVDGKVIYIDPYEGAYEEKADLILVTHSHFDHCDTSKISMIRKGDTVIVAPEDCARKIGGEVKSLKAGESLEVDGVKVTAVEAYNYKRFRSPGVPFHPKGLGVGYVLEVEGKRIYHAGDTDFIPEMKDLKNIDLALVPSGGTYTMDNPEAAEAVLAFKPKKVMPMHRWDTDPEEFKREVESKSNVEVVILNPGEELTL
ncbi:MBL fold metallo-hydrolase [Candidatus Bathyarchaeota archaeon]|nr:MAG: MBL fold metallo-hydrolase [Candidatus Bathyarchaeota archaeon]